jgi:hypothetical protein
VQSASNIKDTGEFLDDTPVSVPVSKADSITVDPDSENGRSCRRLVLTCSPKTWLSLVFGAAKRHQADPGTRWRSRSKLARPYHLAFDELYPAAGIMVEPVYDTYRAPRNLDAVARTSF